MVVSLCHVVLDTNLLFPGDLRSQNRCPAKACTNRIPRNIHQKYGYHCWWRTCLGPFLAKTSRTAVLTAIMDLSAGGRLYKCLYKMHVDSRAFWGAFWGAFRVFLIDVG